MATKSSQKSLQTIYIVLAVVTVLALFVFRAPIADILQNFGDQTSSNMTTEEVVTAKGNEVLLAFKNNDMVSVSGLVHPEKGVRFSTSAFVDVENNLVFTSEQMKNALSDATKYIWGVQDGSGLPIEFTLSAYIAQSVNSQDFANAQEIGYNRIIGSGNTINNITEAYPAASFVEYHFSGFNPEFDGMDWQSLRLVFEQMDGEWYLVGIVNDGWTI